MSLRKSAKSYAVMLQYEAYNLRRLSLGGALFRYNLNKFDDVERTVPYSTALRFRLLVLLRSLRSNNSLAVDAGSRLCDEMLVSLEKSQAEIPETKSIPRLQIADLDRDEFFEK